MTDRRRSISPTPRERSVMSDREIMEFTLDRTDALQEGITDLAVTGARQHEQMMGAIARMSYVASKHEERADDHEERIKKLEHKVIWVGGAAAGVGLILGAVWHLVGG